MLTEHEVLTELKDFKGFYSFVPYITRIANIYIDAGMDEGMIRYVCIAGAAGAASSQTGENFRKAFIQQCAEYGAPEGVAVPMPGDNISNDPELKGGPVNPKYAPDIVKLRYLRTQKSNINGKLLAESAIAMKGWFKWVSSGPRQPGTDYQSGPDFGIKTSWTATANNKGALEEHDKKRNDFAKWLVKNAEPPNRNSSMNCWEAIFYSAWKAGLISVEYLRIIHQQAAQAYKGVSIQAGDNNIGGRSYYDTLNLALNYFESVPYKPDAGLIPHKGDIVFWADIDGLQHVAISLGCIFWNNDLHDEIMSLWHNPFEITSIQAMVKFAPDEVKFVPCPF